MVKNRRFILIGVVALMLLLEIIEHALIIIFGEAIHIVYDVALYLILFPAGVWLMLDQLKTLETEREQDRADNDMRAAFSQKLGDAQTWDELVRQILEYPHQVAPQANITLYVCDPNNLRMQPEASCSRDGQVTLKPAIPVNPDTLPVGSLPQLLMQNGNGFTPFHGTGAGPALPSHRYDLSITRNGQQIGVLKLEYPPDQAPLPEETHALKGVAPVIALALEGALLQTMAAEQAAASENQRQAIAQNLHDTLAQNIGYLRLKLDQLAGENVIREIGAVLQELERMRTTADEAYQQVRNTLDELNPIRGENLSSTLFKQGQAISQRAGFHLRTSQVGAARPLPSNTRQQILYIVREALYNIEKHAQARQVYLQLLWLEAELIIKIADDGVGFNSLAVPIDGHYGLWIMQQRAQEIGGTLKIGPASSSGDTGEDITERCDETPGTEVTLWVPIHPTQENAGGL